jgi:hypothetical protein
MGSGSFFEREKINLTPSFRVITDDMYAAARHDRNVTPHCRPAEITGSSAKKR